MKLSFAFFLVILPALCLSRSVGSVSASGDASEGTEKLMDDMKGYLQHPDKAKESKLLSDVGVKNGQPPPCPTADVPIRDASKIKKIVESFDEEHRAVKEELLKILEDGKFTPDECQKVDQEVKEFAKSAGSSEADDASGDKADDISSGSFLGTDLLLRRRRKALFSPVTLPLPDSFRGRVVLIWTTITNQQVCNLARDTCANEASSKTKKTKLFGSFKNNHFACVLNCGFKTDFGDGNDLVGQDLEGYFGPFKATPFCIPKGNGYNNKKCAERSAFQNAPGDYNVLWTKFSPCNKKCCPQKKSDCGGKGSNLYDIDDASTLGGLWLLCYGEEYGSNKNYRMFRGDSLPKIRTGWPKNPGGD